jgi:DNA ligase-1
MKQVESSEGKLSDTVDCIVMGYTVGKGKRVGFGLGQFLVGIRDGDLVKTVTKVGTGLTDDQFRELKTRLEKLKVNEKPKEYVVSKILEPDFWVTPEVIVEIAADDITKSPNHTANFALRFPRLVKFRDDKSFKEATNLKEVEKLFKLQKS